MCCAKQFSLRLFAEELLDSAGYNENRQQANHHNQRDQPSAHCGLLSMVSLVFSRITWCFFIAPSPRSIQFWLAGDGFLFDTLWIPGIEDHLHSMSSPSCPNPCCQDIHTGRWWRRSPRWTRRSREWSPAHILNTGRCFGDNIRIHKAEIKNGNFVDFCLSKLNIIIIKLNLRGKPFFPTSMCCVCTYW